MSVTYTRYYDRATVIVSSEGLSDVVSSVYCVLTGTDETSYETSKARVSLNIGEDIVLDPPQSTNFIPFDQITKDTIDSWVLEKEQYKALELKVAQGIGALITPAIVYKSLNLEPTPIIEPEVPNVDAPSS